MRKIGGHVSAAGGLEKSFARASEIGANCMQVFSGSPRVWKRAPLDKIDMVKVSAEQKKFSITPVFTHAIYLINLASDKTELITKSTSVLRHDLEFDALVKGSGVIVHLGSHQGRGWEAVREQVAKLIRDLLDKTPEASSLLIENSAGQKGKLCSDLSEIGWLLDQVNSKRLGWCFDTCHGFTAGYGMGEEPGKYGSDAKEENKRGETAIEAITKLKLWSTLKCIHVNDSRDPYGSGRDRHANLGEGSIATQDFKHFFNHSQVKNIPLILEVPGDKKSGPDKKNIDKLKKLA